MIKQFYLFLTIRILFSHLFGHSLNVEQFYLDTYWMSKSSIWTQCECQTVRFDPYLEPYQLLFLQVTYTSHSRNLKVSSFTISVFSVISRTPIDVWGSLNPRQSCSQCIQQPQLTGLSLVYADKLWPIDLYICFFIWGCICLEFILMYDNVVFDFP